MTMYALYKKHGQALECTTFGQFCELWPKVCALLDEPAQIECLEAELVRGVPCVYWIVAHGAIDHASVAECIDVAHGEEFAQDARRVVLLDGTVIREWPAK